MGYEVDVIGVGKESKSGDAIAIRWGNLSGPRNEQKVVIIDGGFRESGQDVVDHIKKYYDTDSVDAVISTHPDQDHINGLDVVIDQLSVEELWIHKPWEHNQGLASKFTDGRVTDNSLGERLRKNLEAASDLVTKAEGKGIRIIKPFIGISLYNQNELQVLGPSLDYYESLIPEFDGMPQAKETIKSVVEEIFGTVKTVLRKFLSVWGVDELDDEDKTSAKNNSSVITQLVLEGRRLLFTGDAGITALTHAAEQLDSLSQEDQLRFIQIPHHGSRRNVGPTILNRLVGEPFPEGETRNISAIASTAMKGEPKHPRKVVMNAFTHRGVRALATRGNTISHTHDAPDREGWDTAKPEPYHWEYEDDE